MNLTTRSHCKAMKNFRKLTRLALEITKKNIIELNTLATRVEKFPQTLLFVIFRLVGANEKIVEAGTKVKNIENNLPSSRNHLLL